MTKSEALNEKNCSASIRSFILTTKFSGSKWVGKMNIGHPLFFFFKQFKIGGRLQIKDSEESFYIRIR